jgi:transposase
MHVLSDEQWAILKPALDAVRSRRRRPMKHERQTIEAVLWRLHNGAKWRAIPAELGPWHRAANLHRRWSVLGVWERVFEHLRDAGHPDLAEVMLDGTSVRAHQKAAGAKGGHA